MKRKPTKRKKAKAPHWILDGTCTQNDHKVPHCSKCGQCVAIYAVDRHEEECWKAKAG